MPTRRERLEEFYRRLSAAPASRNFKEAFEEVARILTEVENELTAIAENPNPNLNTNDGRMYPPQMDKMYDVRGAPRLKRFRSRRHDIFIGENGSIEIRSRGGVIEFSKTGADGKGVWDL